MRDRPATIKLVSDPRSGRAGSEGPVHSVQAAELELPSPYLAEIWTADHLERLAASYWAYLERISLRLIRVIYEPRARTVVLLSRRLPLLRFGAPEYATDADSGSVRWPIDRGVLVAPEGHESGYLKISVRRLDRDSAVEGMARVRAQAEVANFYPGIRRGGRLARISAWFYNQTQVRLHTLITHGFLRSLARLELPASRVGAMAANDAGDPGSG